MKSVLEEWGESQEENEALRQEEEAVWERARAKAERERFEKAMRGCMRELDRRTRWLYERGADGRLKRYKTMRQSAEEGEIELMCPDGHKEELTERNIALLDLDGYTLVEGGR